MDISNRLNMTRQPNDVPSSAAKPTATSSASVSIASVVIVSAATLVGWVVALAMAVSGKPKGTA